MYKSEKIKVKITDGTEIDAEIVSGKGTKLLIIPRSTHFSEIRPLIKKGKKTMQWGYKEGIFLVSNSEIQEMKRKKQLHKWMQWQATPSEA